MLVILAAALVGILVGVRIVVMAVRSGGLAVTGSPTVDASLPIEVPPAVLAAHGVVQPVARANLATLTGGSVSEITVAVGDVVEKSQILARVVSPSQTELVVAPWRGTVSSLSARSGDTLAPGAAVLTIADLSRFQVET
ncbi:MAG: HlyD family efflux transporter periplasmic adaptor subunit, partial [Chloroflexota bacterium]|nr:HlyD family efflux transporter periplasmic adaptor subunit [Chloroflexota bacterium]